MESRAPTRWARAIAYLIDGGLAVLTLLQTFSVTLYLGNLSAEDVSMFGDLALSGQARWCLVLGVFWLLFEVAQGHAYLRGAPSFGFAVTGLALEGAERRPRLRRMIRMLLPIATLFALARLYLTREDVLSTETIFVVAKAVTGGACTAALILTLVDAIIVLRDPSDRTLGDWLARAKVSSRAPTGDLVRRALHVASLMTFASAALNLLAGLESLNGEDFLVPAFVTPATMLGYMTSLAIAWAFATACGATCERVGMPRRHPVAIAVLVTLPVVSLFFVRGYVKRLAEALELSHEASMGLRGVVDLAMAARSVFGVLAFAEVASLLHAKIIERLYGTPPIYGTESLLDAFYLSGASFLGTIALGVALRRLSKLDYERLLAPEQTGLEEVFA